MYIVHGEQAGYAHLAGVTGDKASHPVVAVYEVRTHSGDDIVDYFALKHQAYLHTLAMITGVNPVAIEKYAVLGEVQALLAQTALVVLSL